MQTWRTRRHPLHTRFIHWLINTGAKLKPVSSWNTQRAPWVREINDGSKANLSPQWDWVWHCRSRHLSIILLFLKREQPWFGSSFKCRLGCCTNSKTIYNLKTRYQYSLVWHYALNLPLFCPAGTLRCLQPCQLPLKHTQPGRRLCVPVSVWSGWSLILRTSLTGTYVICLSACLPCCLSA